MFDEEENFEGEKKIVELLTSLKRVDAPRDFDTHVRSRIARGATVSATSWSANLIRVGVPVAAAMFITLGGYFVFTSINTGQNDAPTIVETQSELQNSAIQAPSNYSKENETANRIIEKPSDEMMADKINNFVNANSPDGLVRNEKDKTSANSNTDRPTAGSADLAVRESQKIYPRGLNPNAKLPANAKGIEPNARIHVISVFDFIGVKATWTGNGWRVDSVDANNIAGRSGIKTGDVVEAINGQNVGEKTTFPAKFDGRGVRVRRDGASLSIDFKP